MALDLAIDFGTGDLLISPNNDVEIRTGQATVDQRIRVRLMIFAGDWELDPTGGQLGSHLHDATRYTTERALKEIPLMVREALQPMTDIEVRDVQCVVNAETVKAIDVTIVYAMFEDDQSNDVLTTTLTIEG